MEAGGWRTQDGRDLRLSERQRQVLDLIARGRTNAEIGEALGMSLDGAKWHVSEIISKLGVANREEAAALWRKEQRSTRLFRTHAMQWLLGGPGAIAGAGLTIVLAIALTRGGEAPPPAVPDTSLTAAPSQSPGPLTAEDIVQKSGERMAKVPYLRVETLGWPAHPRSLEERISVMEYSLTTARLLRDPYLDNSSCSSWPLPVPAFSERHLGGNAMYGPSLGASLPASFELLGEAMIDGETAWVVRYAYTRASDDSKINVEDTEWIAKSDYRLLRLERDYVDTMGFVGQWVSIFRPIESLSTGCPVAPELSAQELTPLTQPRISQR